MVRTIMLPSTIGAPPTSSTTAGIGPADTRERDRDVCRASSRRLSWFLIIGIIAAVIVAAAFFLAVLMEQEE